MRKVFSSVLHNKEGVSALEYGLMAALIAGALVTSVTGLSGNLSDLFSSLGTLITSNTPSTN